MSDFPHQGTTDLTREWLARQRFDPCFIGYDADSLIGLDKEDILAQFSNNRSEGIRLWGLLKTARRNKKAFMSTVRDTLGGIELNCFACLIFILMFKFLHRRIPSS